MILPEDIAALAEFYDRFANAFERTSPDRLLARRQFYARVEAFYEREGKVSLTMRSGSKWSSSASTF